MRSFAGPFGAIPDAVARRLGRRARRSSSGEPRADGAVRPAIAQPRSCSACSSATLVALVGAIRRLPLAYWLYAVAALALPLSYPVEGQPLMSLPRFVAVLWPLHLWLALWLVERGRARGAVVVGASRSPGWRVVSALVVDLGLGRVTRAVLLDALGTLVELPPPAPALVEELAARGVARARERGGVGDRRGDRLLPRAPATTARDARGARARCARAAPRSCATRSPRTRATSTDLQDALLGALRFRAYPEVPEALRRAARAAGLRLVVVEQLGRLAARGARAHRPRAARRRRGQRRPRSARPSPTRRSSRRRSRVAGVAAARGACTSATRRRPTSPARAPPGIEPVLVVRDGGAGARRRQDDRVARVASIRALSTSPTWEIRPELPGRRRRRPAAPARPAQRVAAVDGAGRAGRRARRRALRRR